jgi:RNA polymerase sigma-70 factor (ECF subfamily)
LNEQELIISLQQGDQQAFKQLVNHWQHMVFNTVLGIVQDTQEAEDLAQEVFIQVYQSIAGFRNEARLSTWLYRIAVTKALDAERRKKTKKRFAGFRALLGREEDSDEGIAHFIHPGVQLENKEKAAVLFNAMKGLPQNQRIAFLLIKTEGLSYEATAEIMKITVKAVEALMHRAKQNLRKALEKYYSDTG